jgi:hypothetical protein
VKIIAHTGGLFLAKISGTEISKLCGYTSRVAFFKAHPDQVFIGLDIDIATTLAALRERTVPRPKVESVRDALAREVKRLDALLGEPEPTAEVESER